MSAAARELDYLEELQRDPVLFFTDALGVTTLEEYQKEILRAVAANDRVAIAACHDVGKSFTFARVVPWFLSCFPGSKIITTAPTYNQVKNILWSEIRAAHARARIPLGGTLNQTEWQMGKDGDWFAIGFSPQKSAGGTIDGQGTPSSFQGFHAPYVLILFDEATGIPPVVWSMAEGMTTSHNVKFLAIGNPTSRSSEFCRCFSSPLWHKIYLNCFNSPNLTANGITTLQHVIDELNYLKSIDDEQKRERLANYKVVRPYLLTFRWVMERALEWGLDHPLMVSKAFGRFPDEADDVLVGLGHVEAAMRRIYIPQSDDPKILGVDVARFGRDSTIVTGGIGKRVQFRKPFNKLDLMAICGHIVNAARELGGVDRIVVDETGLGGGVVDRLRELARGPDAVLPRHCVIIGVQFGESKSLCKRQKCSHTDCDKSRFMNQKTRMYHLLAQDIKVEDGITLPDNESIYLDELPTIKYEFDSKGVKFIESKDEYKTRTKRNSPDSSDSLALWNYGRHPMLGLGDFPKSGQSQGDLPKPFAGSLNAGRSW